MNKVRPPHSGTPAVYTMPSLSQARALKSLEEGKATQEQQREALRWIFAACGAGQEDFIPGDPHATSYLAGRKSVMYQIGWVLGQPPEAFRKQGEKDE